MHRRVIYQSLAFVPVVAAAVVAAVTFTTTSAQVVNRTVVYEDRTTYAQTPVETITLDKWYRPLEIPTRRDKRRITEQQSFSAPPQAVAGTASIPIQSTTHQLLNKTVVYEPDAYTPFTPAAAEIVTVDKWWRQLDLPVVRRKLVTAEEGAVFGAPPRAEANDAIGWHRALKLPTRRKLITEGAYSTAPPRAEANDAIGWYRTLELPTRRKLITEGAYSAAPPKPEAKDQVAWHDNLKIPPRVKRLPVTAGLSFTAAAPSAGAEYNWFSGLDLPTRLRRSLQTDLGWVYFLPAAVEEVTVDKWWQQLDAPTRRKTIVEGAYSSAPPRPEANDQVAWLNPLGEPIRPRAGIRTATQDGEARDVFPQVPWGWHRPLEAPTRAKRLPLGGYQFEARYTFPTVPWGWYAKLDEPFRLKKTPTAQLSLTFVAAAPSDGTAYNWFLPIEMPTRARKLYEFPATAIPVYFVPPTPGAGFEYNWFAPIDEPIRPRKSIKTAQQLGLAVPPRLLTTTLENAWHQRLDEPVRLKVTFGKYPGGTVQGNVNPVVPAGFAPLKTPTRRKQSLYTQQNLSYPSLVVVETITLDKWWRPLDLPTRRIFVDQQEKFAAAPYQAPAPGDAAGLWSIFTGQVLSKTVVYEPDAYAPFQPEPPVLAVTFGATSSQVVSKTVIFEPDAYAPLQVTIAAIGGPADEHERVACVPATSREAVVSVGLRDAAVPVEMRVAIVPALLRVVDTPISDRDVDSNEYRDRTCGTPLAPPVGTVPEEPPLPEQPGPGTEYNWFQPLDVPVRRPRLHEYPAAIPVYFIAGEAFQDDATQDDAFQ